MLAITYKKVGNIGLNTYSVNTISYFRITISGFYYTCHSSVDVKAGMV